MGAFWRLEESRLAQIRSVTSAANADSVAVGDPGVPDGKIWIILGAAYQPSVAETQVVSFLKYNGKTSQYFGVLNPVSLNLNPAWATCIEQGMEYCLYPSEYFLIRRVTHTAGSSMTAAIQFVEIDQPLYTYDDPLVIQRQQRAISSVRSRMAGPGGIAVSMGPPTIGGRSGGRSGIPV